MGDTADSTKGTKDPLYVASRAQLNFAENVPLVLAVALLAELNGANRSDYFIENVMLQFVDISSRTYINSALGALFACRIGHAEFGLLAQDSKGVGRIIGFYGTQTILATLAGYTAYLIKGYWQI
jgi:uncharacterized membrane protein YecN with MAPEG domain|tara:strand:- start:2962 stop:3336 length:375 start_codon:yes stop_codon:yes gene_type:complete